MASPHPSPHPAGHSSGVEMDGLDKSAVCSIMLINGVIVCLAQLHVH